MALKEAYDSQDDIPEAFRELYEESDGKFVFNGVEGVASSAQVGKLRSEAASWRSKLREAEGKLSKFSAFGEFDDLQAKLDELEDLKLSGSKDSEAAERLKEAHNQRLNRQKSEFDAELAKTKAVLQHYEQQAKVAAIKAAVEKAALEYKGGKLAPGALEDALMYAQNHFEVAADRGENGLLNVKEVLTRDGVGVTGAVDASVWLGEMLERKTHWLVQSSGGGAAGSTGGGGGSANPFTAAGWDKGAQGRVFREQGLDKANQLAKAAGFSGFQEAAGATKAKK